MTDQVEDNKATEGQEVKVFEWVPSKTPIPEIYSNYIHTSWSLFDVRILFGQLKAEFGNSQHFVVEERAAASLAWAQAKALAKLLTKMVEKYEEKNGEIKPVHLADRP